VKRILFLLKNILANRKKFHFLRKKKHKIKKITQLSVKFLTKQKIKFLILDFDGVLASCGSNVLEKEASRWLQSFSLCFKQENIFILSNNPSNIRKSFFKKKFPKISFITNVEKKPNPEGIIFVQKKKKCHSREIALVDDKVFTGILACLISGETFPILLLEPYVNYDKYFLESILSFLYKKIERILLFLVR